MLLRGVPVFETIGRADAYMFFIYCSLWGVSRKWGLRLCFCKYPRINMLGESHGFATSKT